jgi:hypothetical protein
MSTDWGKYSSVDEARARARRPQENGIVTLEVAAVRSVSALTVQHSPFDANQAHTDVIGIGTDGPRTNEVRHLLWSRCSQKWAKAPDV